jgi:hypothetical protein
VTINDRIGQREHPLALLRRQRSHVLLVLGSPRMGYERAFLAWYCGEYRDALALISGVLSAAHYEQHEVDITQGGFSPLPFRYLGIYELSLDGASEGQQIIERVVSLHAQQPAALPPATWLYYPLGAKVGRSAKVQPAMVTVAFANSVPGEEAEFREWYATRHIRHALNIPVLVSGQCLERTQFQCPGAMECAFTMVALYEQEGTPEEMIESCKSLQPSLFHFPTLDLSAGRFAEWAYRPL